MEHWKRNDRSLRLQNTALTLGKFDGIHRGHRRLVDQVLAQKEKGLLSVLCTISPPGKMILSGQERASLLEDLGLDALLECPLTDSLRTMSARDYVEQILVRDLGAVFVTVGEDYRFGFQRQGDADLLSELGKEFGFEVCIVPSEMDGDQKISSSLIRQALALGQMERVAFLLGTSYFLDASVGHGRRLGHRLHFPTINLRPGEDKLLPPKGVYFTQTWFGDRAYFGMTNIGNKPTVGPDALGVETHLFDCKEDLYGLKCRTLFFHFHRPEQTFPSLEALGQRLEQDKKAAKDYLANSKT